MIYDNDMYTDELIMTLQAQGRIDLRSLVTTKGGEPHTEAIRKGKAVKPTEFGPR